MEIATLLRRLIHLGLAVGVLYVHPSAAHAAASPHPRIVSLVPSLTDSLFAIGAGAEVVGVDAYSTRPLAASRLPKVGGLHGVSAEAILAQHPDLVVGADFQARDLADVARAGVRTETFVTSTIADDFATMERLGTLTGHAAEAHAVHLRIAGRLAALAREAKERPERTAFVAIGVADLYTAARGTYLDDLLTLANLRNVAADLTTRWPHYSAERLIEDAPAIVIVPAPHPPLDAAPWTQLAAVRSGHVVDVPEDDLLQPGPRVADVLATIVRATRTW